MELKRRRERKKRARKRSYSEGGLAKVANGRKREGVEKKEKPRARSRVDRGGKKKYAGALRRDNKELAAEGERERESERKG